MADGRKNIVILKTGSSFPETRRTFGDFDEWIMAYAGLTSEETRVIEAFSDDKFPTDNCFCGVIITGSHAMVTDGDEWIARASQWIMQMVELQMPVLGICFGHQLLAHAMGGDVGYHAGGREVGTVGVFLTPEGVEDSLLGGMPEVFPAHATHVQTVTRLPRGAIRLASNSFEPHHAFRIGTCAWGVQFHPEFSVEVMHAYIDHQRDALPGVGCVARTLKACVKETAAANSLLKRFTDYCRLKRQ